jgi:hypothetical protein
VIRHPHWAQLVVVEERNNTPDELCWIPATVIQQATHVLPTLSLSLPTKHGLPSSKVVKPLEAGVSGPSAEMLVEFVDAELEDVSGPSISPSAMLRVTEQ